MRELAGIGALMAGFWLAAAEAGFRTPESLVRNVYAHYGEGAPELSKGLPRDAATAPRLLRTIRACEFFGSVY